MYTPYITHRSFIPRYCRWKEGEKAGKKKEKGRSQELVTCSVTEYYI
jgi:hypothetical protein